MASASIIARSVSILPPPGHRYYAMIRRYPSSSGQVAVSQSLRFPSLTLPAQMYHVNVSEVVDMVGQKAEALSTRGQLRIMEFVRKYMVSVGQCSAARYHTRGAHGVVWKANDGRIDGNAPCVCPALAPPLHSHCPGCTVQCGPGQQAAHPASTPCS